LAQTMGYGDEQFPFHIVGVAEKSQVGEPHAHICTFVVMSGEPQPLNDAEEKRFLDELNRWLYVWELDKRQTEPKHVLRRKWMQDLVASLGHQERKTKTDEKGAVYKIKFARPKNEQRNVQSGVAGHAIGYSLKTVANPVFRDNFVASIGITQAVTVAKLQRDVRVKTKSVIKKPQATYNMKLVSMLAYEAAKQLTYRKPEQVACWIQHGRLLVSFKKERNEEDFKLLVNNDYLLIGVELLRRHLVSFDGASRLRRATVQVSRALCSAYSDTPRHRHARPKQ
jgi:hypothetical protein